MASVDDDADAGDVLVPTREQAQILRLFCERGHMGWLGDVSSYRLLMQKLHVAIQDIQREAVQGQSEDGLLAAGRGTDVLVAELQHAHRRIADLEKQLQHGRSARSLLAHGRQLALEETEDLQHEHAVVMGLQQRLSGAQAAAADELQAALGVNAELKDKVKQLEERVLAASISAAEMQVAHGKELAVLERKLEEAAALSAEKTRLLLQAEEHIKGLHVQAEEVRHAAGRRAEEAAADRDREAMTKMTEELALLQLKFAKQQIRHGELEAKYKAQLTEAQSRLTEAQQQLERKGQELWGAASSCSELRQEMETLRRQAQKDRLEWELQLERQKRLSQSPPSTSAPRTTATGHPGMPSAASRLAGAAADLLKRLGSSASASTSAGDGSRAAASTDGGWHRRAGAVLSSVELAARRLLEMCGQEHAEGGQLEAVDLLLQLLEQTEALVAALHGALDSAAASDLLLKAFQSQVEQLSADAHKVGMLQLHVQQLQEERDDLRHHVNEKQQELTERQDLLNSRSSDHETTARQAANLRSALRDAQEQLAQQEVLHQHQLEAVQGQVQVHMDTMASAYREELEAIKAQLCGLSPVARSYAASPLYSPGARPQSMPPMLGHATPFFQRLQSEVELQPVRALQQQLEQLLRENEQLRELHHGSTSAESAELLQQAYAQLSQLQQKYKSLKQSYVKQTLRQHAINQSLLQQAGPGKNEKENDVSNTPEPPDRPRGSVSPSQALTPSTSQLHYRSPQRLAGTPEHDYKQTPSPRLHGKDVRSATYSRTDAQSEGRHQGVQQSSRAANVGMANRGRRTEKPGASSSSSSSKAGLNRRTHSSLSPLRQVRH